MPYIGNKTADTTLVEDNSISSAKIVDDAVIESKLNLISTSSVPSLEAKGTSGVTEGYIQLNCAENSHGIKLKSPPHSAGQSYTLTLPSTAPASNKIMQTDGSGNLSFVDTPSGTWVQTGRINNSSVGATTINLEGCFSNTYDVYMMIMRDFRPSVDGSRMRMIILTGTNTLVTGSHYRIAHSIDYASGTGSGGVKTERHTGSDEFHFFDSVADAEAHGGGSATLFITVDKTNTSGNTFKFHGTCSFTDSSDQQNTGKLGGFYKESTNDENPTGLQFKSDNNITSIDVTVYGLVQS